MPTRAPTENPMMSDADIAAAIEEHRATGLRGPLMRLLSRLRDVPSDDRPRWARRIHEALAALERP
jgi:hypothetical protein